MNNFDVIVIGSGIGGRSAAMEAQKHKLSVAVFDYVQITQFGNSWLVGGTSINSGDIPLKLFYKASQFHDLKKNSSKLGITFQRHDPVFNWVSFMNSVQLFCKTLSLKQQTLFHDTGIRFYNGFVSFIDNNTIQATGSGMIQTKFRAHIFIVATGTQPFVPKDIIGHDLAITSDDIFSMKRGPSKVLIIGCTSTSVECAGFLRLTGVEVTIVVDSQPLRNVDEECACRILDHLDFLGVKFLWKYKVERIEDEDINDIHPRRTLGSQVESLHTNLRNYFTVKSRSSQSSTNQERQSSVTSRTKNKYNYSRIRKVILRRMTSKEERLLFTDKWWTTKDRLGFPSQNSKIPRIKQKMVPVIIDIYDVVMFAQGRVANAQDLGLDSVQVSMDFEGKIISNDHDETNCETIYAIGDVVSGRPGLSSVAAKSGKFLIDRLYSYSKKVIDYDFVPRVILTPFMYSYVGFSEEEAVRIYGFEQVEIYERSFRPLSWKILKIHKNISCYAKMVCVEENGDSMYEDRVVGLHYIGPNADDIIQGFELVLKLGVDRKTINDMITIYPSDAMIFSKLVHSTNKL